MTILVKFESWFLVSEDGQHIVTISVKFEFQEKFVTFHYGKTTTRLKKKKTLKIPTTFKAISSTLTNLKDIKHRDQTA